MPEPDEKAAPPRTENHPATLAYLDERARFGIKFGLETTCTLLDALGSPEAHAPVLLVAGTNGKGSVASYVASALRASGLRTGLYTSPHLVRVHERIAVDGTAIDDDALFRLLEQVREASDALVARGAIPALPTFFEALTAMALCHFRNVGTDVDVVEVGLGGRLDATNATAPLVSAIVSVDFDHEAYLGESLRAIAGEKAGVMRPGRPTVTGQLPAEAEAEVLAQAARCGARIVEASAGANVTPRGDLVDISTPRNTYRDLRPLPGAHQRANLLVAVRLLEEAAEAGLAVDFSALAGATAATQWPGRLQLVPGHPALLLDGAHNPAGTRALASHLRSCPPFVLVFGVMEDKGLEAMAAELFPLAREIVLTRPREGRAAAPDAIASRAGAVASRARLHPEVGTALALGRSLAGPDGLVVVAGSLYLVGEVLGLLEAEKR